MKPSVVKSLKIIALILMGLVLTVSGLVLGVYSSWFQRQARLAVEKAMNSKPGTTFTLDSFRLDFPLTLSLGGLKMIQNGDTMIRADRLDADLSLLSLLRGKVDIDRASLTTARYQLGTRDSATCVVVNAASVTLDPASMTLSPMHIDVEHASMSDGTVDVYINPAPPETPLVTTPPTPLTIDARAVDLHNFTFRLNMMPIIDTLVTHIDYARLSGGRLDLVRQTVDVADFSGHGLRARYIVPDSAAIAATIVRVDTTASEPWTVRVSKVGFDSVAALYTTQGYLPVPGLDFGYLALDKGTLKVENFYNRATDVVVPVKITGTERCGVDLSLDGTLKVSETRLNFDNISFSSANGSRLSATGMMGVGNPVEDTSLPLGVSASGALACSDLALMFPMMKPYVAGLPSGSMLDADIDVGGNMARLGIRRMHLGIDGSVLFNADGDISDVLNPARMAGDITFSGKIGNLSPWRRMLADALGDIAIPPMDFDGDISFCGESYDGSLRAVTSGGRLALDGSFSGKGADYDIDLTAERFPVSAFMPALGVGIVTGRVTASGHGFNFFSPATGLDADLDIASIEYNRRTLTNISGTVGLADGHADIALSSQNRDADFDLTASGTLSKALYDWTVSLDSRSLDLYALGLAESPMAISGALDLKAKADPSRLTLISATADIPWLVYTDSVGPLKINDLHARIDATADITNLSVSNGDMYAYFSAPMSLDSVFAHSDRLSAALEAQFRQHRIDIVQLQNALPAFSLNIDGGSRNALAEYLAQNGIDVGDFSIEAINDSIFTLDSRLMNLRMGETRMDSLSFDVRQNGNRLDYYGRLRNRPGTLDQWASVDVDGYFRPGRLGIDFHQRDIKGNTGFEFGAYADLSPDSTITLHIDPLDPTIGYQQWLVNEGNFVKYDFRTRHVDAMLRMRSEQSSLAIFTEHAGDADGHLHGVDENLVVQLSDIRLQDWITFNPFAPPVKGNLSADVRLNYHDSHLVANGKLSLADLYYGRKKVGDFDAGLSMRTSPGGVVSADLDLAVNGTKALTLSGALNDSTRTSPFLLDLTMIHFPLSTVNPFIPGLATLSGTLNGKMNVSGEMTAPLLDGYMQFDSTAVLVDMLGTLFHLSPEKIPVDHNTLRISGFSVTACNDNPLSINGEVKLKSLTDMALDLAFRARNMQIVNATRASKGSQAYGKAFIDLDATARGSLDYLDVYARLQLNSGSNVTYVMADAQDVIQSQATGDMVRFVNFNDTTVVAAADSIAPSGMLLNLSALVTVASGTTVSIDLDAKGQNKVQLQSQGTLDYSLSPMQTDGRLTGRLNISKGFVRYTPPLMSEKLFEFDDNSYVAFTGDMLDPKLNIHAVDHIRANVTQEGQNSRLIYFDVSLAVTGSLNNMNVVFDMSTNDDVTIANELQSMSPSQRASQAMNMLLYNVYTGPGTKANANLSGNPLYSFLTSQLNSWAANTIKGVDVSFGIDQYDRTDQGVSRQTMSYSYRVSKSLFNDRFKIAVGGNYSTDVDADQNLAQNLFNDISLEYTLNKAGTMYIKIFRHTGFESILEGEITQTGVGFVYKRKIRRLADMFRVRRRKRLHQSSFTPEVVSPSGSTLPTGSPIAPASDPSPAVPAKDTESNPVNPADNETK